MPKVRNELLVVDGYNVIRATDRYAHLIDEGDADPFMRAREALLSDVAAFAQGSYDPVVVFDGAGNLSPDRPNLNSGSVRVIFSRTGQDADEVIEQLAVEARHQGRDTTVATSDNTVRATIGGVPVKSISSSLIAHEFTLVDHDVATAAADRSHHHITLADRLSPEMRAKLDGLRRG
jgi:predicted RNA-binding protein with PIN domain